TARESYPASSDSLPGTPLFRFLSAHEVSQSLEQYKCWDLPRKNASFRPDARMSKRVPWTLPLCPVTSDIYFVCFCLRRFDSPPLRRSRFVNCPRDGALGSLYQQFSEYRRAV